MGQQHYINAADLPPRPDPLTGMPRLPHAPGFWGNKIPTNDSDREHDPAKAPPAPPGQGPVLAWYRASKSGSKGTAIIFGIAIAVILLITRGGEWITHPEKYWAVWTFIVFCSVGIYIADRVSYAAAGADWVLRGKKWVKTYELVKVTCHTYHPDGASLYLKDSAGRKVRIKLISLSLDDQLLWDLTYNGILHSVIAGGAKTNRLARRTLALPLPKPEPGSESDRAATR